METSQSEKLSVEKISYDHRVPKAKRKKLKSSLSFGNLQRLNESLRRESSSGSISKLGQLSSHGSNNKLNGINNNNIDIDEDPDNKLITRGMCFLFLYY